MQFHSGPVEAVTRKALVKGSLGCSRVQVVIFMAIAIDHAAIFFTIVEAHLARSSSSSTAAAPSFGPDGPELGFDATQDAITGLKGWKLAVAPFFLYWILAW